MTVSTPGIEQRKLPSDGLCSVGHNILSWFSQFLVYLSVQLSCPYFITLSMIFTWDHIKSHTEIKVNIHCSLCVHSTRPVIVDGSQIDTLFPLKSLFGIFPSPPCLCCVWKCFSGRSVPSPLRDWGETDLYILTFALLEDILAFTFLQSLETSPDCHSFFRDDWQCPCSEIIQLPQHSWGDSIRSQRLVYFELSSFTCSLTWFSSTKG